MPEFNKSMLAEFRSHFATREEIEEEKRLEEQKRQNAGKDRLGIQLKNYTPVDIKISKRRELIKEKLFNLKNGYKYLMREKSIVKRGGELNRLTKELNKLRLRKQLYYQNGYSGRFLKEEIERAQIRIKEISRKIREKDKRISKKIKIIKNKIEQLKNDLSSGKFMTDKEIKKKLFNEEKGRLKIERLRDEVRKELFEKEFKAIPEDEKIRFISDEVKEFVWRRDQAKCVKCGSQDRLEFDHIIPFSKGGSNTARNIQLLCEKCNRSKHDSI